MGSIEDPFRRADYVWRRSAYQRWHRYQSRLQILRAQVGFAVTGSARPKACRGCVHYHGVAYGYDRERRSVLVCGFHPSGWVGDRGCPDWSGTTLCEAKERSCKP